VFDGIFRSNRLELSTDCSRSAQRAKRIEVVADTIHAWMAC